MRTPASSRALISQGSCLDENIELGLLVRGAPTPRRIARYVRGLMAEDVLARA
jgi:hypothetical protein